MPPDLPRRFSIERYRVDVVELRQQIGKVVTLVIVGRDSEQAVKAGAEDVKISLGQQAYRYNSIFGQRRSPGVGRGNGRWQNWCPPADRYAVIDDYQAAEQLARAQSSGRRMLDA